MNLNSSLLSCCGDTFLTTETVKMSKENVVWCTSFACIERADQGRLSSSSRTHKFWTPVGECSSCACSDYSSWRTSSRTPRRGSNKFPVFRPSFASCAGLLERYAYLNSTTKQYLNLIPIKTMGDRSIFAQFSSCAFSRCFFCRRFYCPHPSTGQ